MDIGFTGTRNGMSSGQISSLYFIIGLLGKASELTFHHGDCVGADEQAHKIVGYKGLSITIHPPLNPGKRAFCRGTTSWQEKSYMDRNRDIVDCCGILIACPENLPGCRSGTWATIRYARKLKKRIIIIWPDGEFKEEGI